MGLDAMRLHSREEFQTWLANDLEVRDELYALLGGGLDPDADSLDALEDFLLSRYPAPEAALTLDQRGVLDAAARHIGLVLVLNVDEAVWTIDLDDDEGVYYRLPIIAFADGSQECPLTMATALLDRRTGHYLRQLLTVYQEDYNS
jgi:hypothetical protein